MKKEEKTELTKEKIIQAAMREFGTRGYAGTTINAICGGYGISKGLLYHNFTGKEELYLICVKNCFLSVITFIESQEKKPDLEKYLELRFQYFSQNPLYAQIFFEALLQPPKELNDKIRLLKQDFDLFNRKIYSAALSGMTLRAGITEEEVYGYYEIMQEMFNCYFSSPAYAGKDMQMIFTEHESKLPKMLDLMLYGIIEREK